MQSKIPLVPWLNAIYGEFEKGTREEWEGRGWGRTGNCIVKCSLSFKQLFTTMYTRCPLGIPIKLPPTSTPPTLHRAMLNSLFFMCFLWQLQPALSTQRNEMCQVMKSTKHKQDNPSPEFHKPRKWKCSLERGGNASRLMKEALSCPPPPMRKFPLLNYSLIYRSNREGGLFCWITDWSTVRSLYRFIEN